MPVGVQEKRCPNMQTKEAPVAEERGEWCGCGGLQPSLLSISLLLFFSKLRLYGFTGVCMCVFYV